MPKFRSRNICDAGTSPVREGIDTRALTRHLRTRGAMKACLTNEGIAPEEAVRRAVEGEGVIGMDYVREVTATARLPMGSKRWRERRLGRYRKQSDPTAGDSPSHRGLRLRDQGKHPAPATAERIWRHRSAGDSDAERSFGNEAGWSFPFQWSGRSFSARLHASCGARSRWAECRSSGSASGTKCSAYAFGGKTFKLKFGHRGGNQPVKDLRTGKVAITSQNHGFAVDPESLPKEVESDPCESQ